MAARVRRWSIFSDGEDSHSRVTFADVRRLIDESDATVFTVGLGRGASQKDLREKLEELADASGGLALFADDPDKLTEPFAEIVETLSNQYTISFEPRRDGKYHELTVQVPGRDVRVRARRGYIARSQPSSNQFGDSIRRNSIFVATVRDTLARWNGAVNSGR